MHFLQDRSWENQNFLKGKKGIPWLNQTVTITMETNANKNIIKDFETQKAWSIDRKEWKKLFLSEIFLSNSKPL